MSIKPERWVIVPGTSIEVSDFGRARLMGTEAPWPSRKDLHGYTILKRPRYYFSESRLPLHRIVLRCFVGPAPDGYVAMHLNDDKSDNRLSNLKWGSQNENKAAWSKNKGKRGKLKRAVVARVKGLRAAGFSRRQIMRATGLDYKRVCDICAGRSYSKVKPANGLLLW